MAREAHEHLHRLLDGDHPPGEYDWHHVLGVMHEVGSRRTPQHERALRRAALFEGRFNISRRAGLPHARPPEEMVRALAVRTLRRWDRHRHAATIRRASALAEHD